MILHRKKSTSFVKGATFALVFGLLGSACQDGNSHELRMTEANCQTNVAQIMVVDGALRRLCGCDEPGDDFVYSPDTLTCTVPAGTTVFFHFMNAQRRHQIVPVGAPGFPATPIYDPEDSMRIPTYGATLDGVGGTAFGFEDQFDPGVNGRVVLR